MLNRSSTLACVAALAVAGAALAQSSPMLLRKPGWWEMDANVEGPTPRPAHQVIRLCTDANIDRVQTPFGIHSGPHCPPPQTTRTDHGWDVAASCNLAAMTITTSGHLSGDLNSRYHVDLVTRLSPPPTPEAAEVRIAMDARRLGDCPPGKKPGDAELTASMNVAPPSGAAR